MSKSRLIFKKTAALLLSVIFLAAFLPFGAGAGDSWELTELAWEYSGYDPIPMLVVKISYDANGNGINDYSASAPTRLTDKNSDCYGEQWCYSPDSYWSQMLFTESGKSLMTYYKINSDGNFWFLPAQETSGTENDGVVSVAIKAQHPQSGRPDTDKNRYTTDNGSRLAALRAASEYVDFASYDKNENGIIDRDELAVLFVSGGYEYSSGMKASSKFAFGTHAHYTSGSGVSVDDVWVLRGVGFVRIGEYTSTTQPASLGTIAHEFGHYLGLPDVYDSDGKWTSYSGELSLMSQGSHSSYSGETRGRTPSNMDAFCSEQLGYVQINAVNDGEYTLFSRQSKEGKYNVLRINTPNPNEYYLIENRYSDTAPDYFDALTFYQKGIIIWHVDANGVNGSLNNYSTTSDPGLVVLAPSGFIGSLNSAYMRNDENSPNKYIFDSSKYRFPVSKTAYTMLTEEEAASYKMTVEVLSVAGNEMKIKVNGAYVLYPEASGGVAESDYTSVSFRGKITSLNGGNAVSCGFVISESANPTLENGTVVYSVPDEFGNFTGTVEGLTAGKKYFAAAFVSGENGTGYGYFNAYTKNIPVVHDYSVVRLYRSITEVERSYEVKMYPGDTLSYKFPMEKRNFVFCGWYLDPEFTEKYDMAFTQEKPEDFTLYAKWVKPDNVASLKLVGGESVYTLFAVEKGDTFVEPVVKERQGYSFGGWYSDEECTLAFDFEAPVTEAGEVVIYAKWTNENGETETTPSVTTAATTTAATAEPAQSSETTAASAGTDTQTTGASSDEGGDKSSSSAVIIVIAAVAAAGVIAAASLIARAKKKSE